MITGTKETGFYRKSFETQNKPKTEMNKKEKIISDCKDVIKGIKNIIILSIIAAGIFLYHILSWSFTTMYLWNWYLTPVFPEVPELTYKLSIGLTLFMMLFKTHNTTEIKPQYAAAGTTKLKSILTPWIVLAVAYLVYKYLYILF